MLLISGTHVNYGCGWQLHVWKYDSTDPVSISILIMQDTVSLLKISKNEKMDAGRPRPKPRIRRKDPASKPPVLKVPESDLKKEKEVNAYLPGLQVSNE